MVVGVYVCMYLRMYPSLAMTDYYIHEQVLIMFYVNDPQISFHRYNKAVISPNVTENDFHECRPGLAVNDLSSVFHKKVKSEIIGRRSICL